MLKERIVNMCLRLGCTAFQWAGVRLAVEVGLQIHDKRFPLNGGVFLILLIFTVDILVGVMLHTNIIRRANRIADVEYLAEYDRTWGATKKPDQIELELSEAHDS